MIMMKIKIRIILLICIAMAVFLLAPSTIASKDLGNSQYASERESSDEDEYEKEELYSDPSAGRSHSINGTVYSDMNSNGKRDESELGLVGWTVRLNLNGSEIRSTRTDRFGSYAFDDLEPGTYTVAEEVQTGWNQTHPNDGTYQIILTDEDIYDIHFGNEIRKEYISNTTTLIHFAPENLKQMQLMRKNLSSAYISPTIKAELLREIQGQSFDLWSHLPIIASERDQGWCGNCWVWSGTGVMEIDNSVRNSHDERLSIQYFSSNYYGGMGCDFDCCGGWPEYFADAYTNNFKKAIPWSNDNAEFVDWDKCCSDSCSACPPVGCIPSMDHTGIQGSEIQEDPSYAINSISLSPIVTSGIPKENAILAIKNILLQNRAVVFSFIQPLYSDFPLYWVNNKESDVWTPDQTYCGEYPYDCDIWGHSVLCLGFDDTDPNNRYWIMVNSWGITPNRPNGIFLVSMDMDYNCTLIGENVFYFDSFDIDWNKPPSMPAQPLGIASGKSGISYSFSTSATDPDGDLISYTFDWGDKTSSTTSPVNSGTSASLYHTWSAAGSYPVKAMATDSKGATSGWSDAAFIEISGEGKWHLYYPDFTDTGDPNSWRSWLMIQNPADEAANIQLELRDRTGGLLYEGSQIIPANGVATIRPLHLAGGEFAGSAVVTSDKPIAGACEINRNNNLMCMSYNAIDHGSNQAILSGFHRHY